MVGLLNIEKNKDAAVFKRSQMGYYIQKSVFKRSIYLPDFQI